MARLTWRQRLIAIAVGIAAAVLQASVSAPKTAHASTAPAATCAAASISNC